MKQRTIKNKTAVKGIGLHTGHRCQAVFSPAPEGTGIQFVRVDIPKSPAILACVENVVDIVRGTTLGKDDVRVYTIEHVLSALHGLGIDNVRIELDDNEPPVGDGSAQLFAKAILQAGVLEQGEERSVISFDTPVEYQANQTLMRVEPCDQFEVECEIDYDHPLIRHQTYVFKDSDDYLTEISPARTYCFDYEIEALIKNGLAKGGSLDNAIVVGPTGIHNPDSKLRFENEFVRHKILDLMGDLYLLGAPIKARVIAKRCGHGHNIKFLRQLLQDRSLHRSHSGKEVH